MGIIISTEYEKRFIKTIKSLTGRYGIRDVWEHFIRITAYTLANQLTPLYSQVREDMYLDIIAKHTKEETEKFADLLAITMQALSENPRQDFLGGILMKLQINNKGTAQILTPYHIAEMMSCMTLENAIDVLKTKNVLTVSDPCVGCGCFGIASANVFSDNYEKEYFDGRWKNHFCFYGQDIEERAVMTAFIQFTLLGIAGVFKVGNSLSKPMTEEDDIRMSDYWVTPRYFGLTEERPLKKIS